MPTRDPTEATTPRGERLHADPSAPARAGEASLEARRIDALRGLRILDTGAEPAYDDLARLAARVFGVPTALVSLVDVDRQWFKARCGFDADETPRGVSFCTHAIADPDDVLVVEDARDDRRFADNPLVTGSPGVRFYAGAPIRMPGGLAPGTVCILDRVPRRFDAADRELLRSLARQAASLLELRLRSFEAERLLAQRDELAEASAAEQLNSKAMLELVLRGGGLGLWELDLRDGSWVANARETSMLGVATCGDTPARLDRRALVHPDDWGTVVAAFERHRSGRDAYAESTYRMKHADGRWLWVLDRSAIVERDRAGEPVRVIGTHMNITAQVEREQARAEATERLELALTGGELGLWDLDVANRRAVYSDQWWALLGYAPSDDKPADRFWDLLVHPDDEAAARAALRRHADGETTIYAGEVRMRHKDGTWRWFQFSAKVVEWEAAGDARRIVGVNTDVTERKQIEAALGDERRRLRGITDHVPALIAEFDAEGRFVFCNRTYGDWLGVAPDAMLGKTLVDACGERFAAPCLPYLARAHGGERVSFEHWVARPSGDRDLQTVFIPRTDGGTVGGVYALSNDITDLKAVEQKLAILAREDPLTGLPNRRAFEEGARMAMARTRRSKIPIALMYLDIDRFKSINDGHGHAVGDAVLVEFGSRLRASVRSTDVAARNAGDEFVVLLEGLRSSEDATFVAAKIVAAVRAPFATPAGTLGVTTSIGIAIHDGDDTTFEVLLTRADEALYAAKRDGRDGYRMGAAPDAAS